MKSADSLSTGEMDLPGPATKIIAPSGKEVPFARKGADLHLLALETGIYRIVEPGGETNIAVNPPALPAQRVQLTPAEAAEVEGEPLPATSLGYVALAGPAGHCCALAGMVALLRGPGTAARDGSPGTFRRASRLPGLDRDLEEREDPAVRNPNLVGR